ncbi:MAG: nucleoside triphosphate pyrophosphohydrolase [Sphingopyxis sp.]
MPLTPPPPPHTIEALIEIMRNLRDPINGCPWDREQSFASIAPYTIEEAYEVADAIERGNMADMKDELGDLLFQVIYHAQMAHELGAFDFADIVQSLCKKMIRRHPHVYGIAAEGRSTDQVDAWERQKAAERNAQGATSALDGVAMALPALTRAEKLQRRAARVGFDWPDANGPRAKIDEELAEADAEQAHGDAEQAHGGVEQAHIGAEPEHSDALHHEVGDVLFSVVNWARHLGIDSESALRAANARFFNRFSIVEHLATQKLSQLSIDELEVLWQRAKEIEKAAELVGEAAR